jgi:predicted patatin/cPLA2 family phospholipase
MKTGLILEGGAMRGMFTAGVMDVLMENGIHFDAGIGVSAGAVFGCNYKSKQKGRVIRYNTRFCHDKRYASARSLLKTGDYYNVDFCYDKVPHDLDVFDEDTYSKNPMDFYIVATDIVTGKPEYHLCNKGDTQDIRWMQASASMPIAARIVEIDGGKYLDGGISDPIPLRYFERNGFEKNVVILTQPKDYQKKKNKMMPLIRKVYADYPNLVKAMEYRHHDYNATTTYIQAQRRRNKAFVIQPPKSLEIGPIEHDEKELQRVYEIGVQTAKDQLCLLKQFLNEQ